jgi:folate-binding protein YgfZ
MTAGWFDWPRSAVAVTGPDAATYLQSQVSQDLRPLAVGHGTWTFVLQPTGKLDAIARVVRVSDDRFVIETDAGFGDRLEQRLRRFKIRVKCDLEPIGWQCVAVRGPGASRVGPTGDGVLALPCAWPGIEGVDLVGEVVAAPEGWNELSVYEFEALRIAAAWPWMGAEVDDSTIPGETGLVPLAVSFTKGCYPGQELVERIDSRGGNVVHRLRVVDLTAEVAPGTELTDATGKTVGRVTSIAPTAGGDPIALAIVHRSVDPGATLRADDQPVTLR